LANIQKKRIVHWEIDGPDCTTIRVKAIVHFDARGMRRVYGRGDHVGRLTFNMDVWKSAVGLLHVRFWSRSSEVDWESYQVMGMPSDLLEVQVFENFDESWVPEKIRDEYDNWVLAELPFL
jgi:hypothetical protein